VLHESTMHAVSQAGEKCVGMVLYSNIMSQLSSNFITQEQLSSKVDLLRQELCTTKERIEGRIATIEANSTKACQKLISDAEQRYMVYFVVWLAAVAFAVGAMSWNAAVIFYSLK
jgi:hypothetical protein